MTTEKIIRKQLTEETGEDMAPRKAFIKDQASACSAVSCLTELRMGSCVTLRCCITDSHSARPWRRPAEHGPQLMAPWAAATGAAVPGKLSGPAAAGEEGCPGAGDCHWGGPRRPGRCPAPAGKAAEPWWPTCLPEVLT